MIEIKLCIDEIFRCGMVSLEAAEVFWHHKCNEAAWAEAHARTTPNPPTSKGSIRRGVTGVYAPMRGAHA